MCVGLHKNILCFGLALKKHIFLADFRKILTYQNLWKSIQWERSCSMRTERRTDRQTDRQTDMTKLSVSFRYFAKASENFQFVQYTYWVGCTIEDGSYVKIFIWFRFYGDKQYMSQYVKFAMRQTINIFTYYMRNVVFISVFNKCWRCGV
jgi:hypothetical protein